MQAHPAGDIWIGQRNQWFSGVRLRARMTVVKLDGGLWIHSAHPPTDELCGELDRLGEVRWIVVPNRWHHLHATAMKVKYPNATVIGPASAIERNTKLVIDQAATDLPGMRAIALRGVPFLDETLFFHTGTGTLIGTDLMMTGCAEDHFTWRWASKLFKQYGAFKAPPDVAKKTKPNPETPAVIAQLSALPIQRIFVAHSDPIEDRPLEVLEAAWRFTSGG